MTVIKGRIHFRPGLGAEKTGTKPGNKVAQPEPCLIRSQAVELIALEDLGEVPLNVGVRAGHQLQATVQVRKSRVP
jgi:hypothetical protein